MKHFLCIALLLSLPLTYSAAQEASAKTDSLLKILSTTKTDNYSGLFDIQRQLYDQYVINNLPAALSMANRQYNLAVKINDTKVLNEAESWIGFIYYSQGKNDSSLLWYNKALASLKLNPDKGKEADLMNSLANIFKAAAKYDTAMLIYTNLLKYYESVNDLAKQGKVLGNIGSLYYTAGNQEKATEYTLHSLEIQRKTDDKRGKAVSLINLTVFALNKGDFKGAILYGDEAISLMKDIDKNYYAAALIRVGYCYYMTGSKEKALEYTRTAITIYKENKNIRGMMEAYRQQGDYLIESKQYADALKLGKEALQVADTTNRLDMRLLYDMLKRAAIWLNMPEDALFYSQQQINMKEADLNQEWADKIAETDAKYNTAKKELEITTLKAEKKTKNILLVSLMAILATISGIGYFIYKNQKQRQQLSAQRIKELEQEKQITATQSLLEGETIERARISKDLHDGLGGMLSVAKLKIANMKGNMTIPEENVSSFNTAIEMLDTSIKELRRVAHNLMPESLMKFGLNAALSDFCDSTEKVVYHFYGDNRRPGEKLEIAVYRIACELVNNALKHSQADKIDVQLIIDAARLNLIVEDNGKGFNIEEVNARNGNGLKNVHSRVTALGGRIDLISSPGNGTEVNIEFNC
jgi:two-component system, NarL family, sensor kinase